MDEKQDTKPNTKIYYQEYKSANKIWKKFKKAVNIVIILTVLAVIIISKPI